MSIYLFIWLCRVAARRILDFHCTLGDLKNKHVNP